MSNRRKFLKTAFIGSLPFTLSGAPFLHVLNIETPRFIFNEDFKTDPQTRGWEKVPGKDNGLLQWTNRGKYNYISAKAAHWHSPAFDVVPFKYYKVIYQAKGVAEGNINIQFTDQSGNPCITDVYDQLFLTNDWGQHEFCFRSFALAQKCRIQLISTSEEVLIDSISVEETSSREVNDWRKNILSSLPPIPSQPSASQNLLPKTRSKLRNGGKLRIVMLGDSTINDTGNSLFETSLQALSHNLNIEVVNSVRGGTGCVWYQEENRVNDFVLQYNPDLLIIGGISNGYEVEPIRNVIKKVRASQNPEILVLSDSITPTELIMKGIADKCSGCDKNKVEEMARIYSHQLKMMANEEKVDFLDMRSYWNRYIQSSSWPLQWFLRDEIHANLRGKLVVGQVLLNFLKNQ
jgi:lysophospholipase L1-like esterase